MKNNIQNNILTKNLLTHSPKQTIVKTVVLALVLLTSLVSTLAITQKPSYARTSKFYCARLHGKYYTYVQRGDGLRYQFLKWRALGRYSARRRCIEISSRFQRSSDNGTLRKIIGSRMNGQGVICGVSSVTQRCNNYNLLFTLRRGINPYRAAESLFDKSRLAQGRINEYSNNPDEFAIDTQKYLESLKPETRTIEIIK